MIVSNIYTRVMRINLKGQQGTAFTIDYEGNQYLVTAGHLFPPSSSTEVVTLDGNEMIKTSIDFTPIPVRAGVDIAVSLLATPLTQGLPINCSMDGIIFGQDCYFLGYPFGLGLGGSIDPQLAFVKKAILSAHEKFGGPEGVGTLYLDGHNNPGFSGGPVFFYRDGDTSKPTIAGVISGYRAEYQPIQTNGKMDPQSGILGNSGIVVAADIEHVLEAISTSLS